MRKVLVSFFGLGYLPIAPGTWGSAGAIAVYAILWWVLVQGQVVGVHVFDAVVAGLILVPSVICVALGKWAGRFYGKKDPGVVVVDEVAGQWLALVLLAVPGQSAAHMAGVLVFQFFSFRAFDIFKPYPGRKLEKLPDGWGILADDLMVAVYCNLLGQVVFRGLLQWL